MKVVSELVEIPNNGSPSVEYFEEEFTKRNIKPLRWAIVKVSPKSYTISLAKIIL